MEPVQNAGGCFIPPDGYFQRVREICDEFDVLMISDEVICSWVASARGSAPSATTTSPTSSRPRRASPARYAPIGAMIASDRVAEPFLRAPRRS